MVYKAELETLLDETVLCWLASSDEKGWPNVSPKEVFWLESMHLLIANIASAQSERNICVNPQVCVSFVEIFKQKGFKLKALARVLEPHEEGYPHKLALLRQKAPETFPIKNIFDLEILSVKPILAPSYLLFSATESQQVAAAEQVYKNTRLKLRIRDSERVKDAS